jgi:hypothetical protein
MSDLSEYKAFRLAADKFFMHFLQKEHFHDTVSSRTPDRQAIIDALADAGIFPDDEQRRGEIADQCMELAVPDAEGTTAWDKLGGLAVALGAPTGPPWG